MGSRLPLSASILCFFPVVGLSTMNAAVLNSGFALTGPVILDQSPATRGGSRTPPGNDLGWDSLASEQNLGELLVLTSSETLTAMDSYLATGAIQLPVVGDSATIRIWEDVAGTPGSIIHEFANLISVVDLDGEGSFPDPGRAHVLF